MDHIERVCTTQSDALLATLIANVRGPAEAYAALVLTIYRINFEFNDSPLTLVELADTVRKSILSIQKAPTQ
jgi:hypothetical protein